MDSPICSLAGWHAGVRGDPFACTGWHTKRERSSFLDWVTTEYCSYPALSNLGDISSHCSEREMERAVYWYPECQIWIAFISLMSHSVCLSKHLEPTSWGFGRRSEYSPHFSQFVIGDERPKPRLWVSQPILLPWCHSINPTSEAESFRSTFLPEDQAGA